jgi:hypothetical protein
MNASYETRLFSKYAFKDLDPVFKEIARDAVI